MSELDSDDEEDPSEVSFDYMFPVNPVVTLIVSPASLVCFRRQLRMLLARTPTTSLRTLMPRWMMD